jgi:cobalt-zinc-cadmium efflux system membrane fusion protein
MLISRNYCVGLGVLMLLASCQLGDAGLPQNQTEQTDDADHAPEPISITRWTPKTELFVEFAPLVVGKETSFAVHLTDLRTFQAVSEDVVVTTLQVKGQNITVRSETPTSPGIYRPMLTPTEPGTYRLLFARSHPDSPTVLDTIDAGEVEVLAAPKDRLGLQKETREETKEDGISFLKEQQWQMTFATQEVRKRELGTTLHVHAEVKPAAGGEVHITAPISGRALAVESGVPTPGQRVKQGEPLALLLPLPTKSRTDLTYAVNATKPELEAAEQELARVQDLYANRIVPKRRLEQIQKNVAVLKARLAASRTELSLLDVNPANVTKTQKHRPERFLLRAPMAGTVVTVNLTPGAFIEAGYDLFTIMDLEHVWIEGQLFETDISKVQHVRQVRFTAPALSAPLLLSPPDTRLVTIGSVLNSQSRSVPLILAVNNAQGQLKIGMHGELAVPTGAIVHDIAIPAQAVVHDKGLPLAFVQSSGETFIRRELELGIQSNDFVQVRAGLTAGERVVTQGAYRVHLASLSSTLPEHGHGH